LPHLLGFLGSVMVICLTTPAVIAYFNINYSTAAARASLLVVGSSIIFCSPAVNSDVFVKSRQEFAD
jgi:hypothetical protein